MRDCAETRRAPPVGTAACQTKRETTPENSAAAASPHRLPARARTTQAAAHALPAVPMPGLCPRPRPASAAAPVPGTARSAVWPRCSLHPARAPRAMHGPRSARGGAKQGAPPPARRWRRPPQGPTAERRHQTRGARAPRRTRCACRSSAQSCRGPAWPPPACCCARRHTASLIGSGTGALGGGTPAPSRLHMHVGNTRAGPTTRGKNFSPATSHHRRRDLAAGVC